MDLNAPQIAGHRGWRLARLASVTCFLTAGLILTASQAGPALAQASALIAALQ